MAEVVMEEALHDGHNAFGAYGTLGIAAVIVRPSSVYTTINRHLHAVSAAVRITRIPVFVAVGSH